MKKRIIFFVAVTLLLIFSALSVTSCSQDDEIVLYVYNWGEYISDGSDGSIDSNAEFENYCRETLGLNVSVNYSTYSSNESMYAKISSGSAVYDVIIPSDYMIERMIYEELLAPLDISKIPNYEFIDDKFKGDNIYYEGDSGNLYSVPYFYGMIGIIYNSEIVDEADAAEQSWDMMWNEKYSRDILQFNNSRDAFGTALYKMKYDVNDATDEQWTEALELLKKQKDIVQGYVMDEIFNKMSGGSAAIAAYYAGDYLTMYEDNDNLSFYYPKEGTNSYIDAMCIPKNSTNYDLAHEYINFMCNKEIAIANAEYTYYASPLTTVVSDEGYCETMAEVHERAMDILYGEEANSVPTQAYLNLSPERLSYVNSLWEELKVQSGVSPGIYITCGTILCAVVALIISHAIKKKIRNKYYTIN